MCSDSGLQNESWGFIAAMRRTHAGHLCGNSTIAAGAGRFTLSTALNKRCILSGGLGHAATLADFCFLSHNGLRILTTDPVACRWSGCCWFEVDSY